MGSRLEASKAAGGRAGPRVTVRPWTSGPLQSMVRQLHGHKMADGGRWCCMRGGPGRDVLAITSRDRRINGGAALAGFDVHVSLRSVNLSPISRASPARPGSFSEFTTSDRSDFARWGAAAATVAADGKVNVGESGDVTCPWLATAVFPPK